MKRCFPQTEMMNELEKLDVFEEGKLYWLRLVDDSEHYARCLRENEDQSYTFVEDGKELIVTGKNIVRWLKI